MNRGANPLDISGDKPVGKGHDLVPNVKPQVPLNETAAPDLDMGLAQAQTGRAVRRPMASRRPHRTPRKP